MEGAVRAPTSSTTNTADGSTTASATSVISAARTRTAEPGGMDRTENMDMETDTSLLQTPTPWTRISEPGEDLTHSSCPQESVTARTSSSAPLVSSLLPSTNPSSHPSSTRPLSYAQITNRTTSPPSSSSAPLSPSPLKMTETRRQQRTQILRRTAYGTTTKDILQTVTAQMGVPEEQLFECVIRDPDDHRRFYVTYRTQQMKTRTTGKGYYIGDLHIRPTDDYLTGYIPHPPYYIDRQTLDDLLSSFGTVKETSFVTTDRNTRIGGYKFKLKLKNDVGRPTSLLYNGFTMVIRYQDDVKQCAFCKRYGHIISACRTKKAADADRQRARTRNKRKTVPPGQRNIISFKPKPTTPSFSFNRITPPLNASWKPYITRYAENYAPVNHRMQTWQFGKKYVRGRVTQSTMVSPWRLPHFTNIVLTNRRLSVRVHETGSNPRYTTTCSYGHRCPAQHDTCTRANIRR